MWAVGTCCVFSGGLNALIRDCSSKLKTHLLKSRRVLRSKTAKLVRQEFFDGWQLRRRRQAPQHQPLTGVTGQVVNPTAASLALEYPSLSSSAFVA